VSKLFKSVGIAVLLLGIVFAFSACGGGDDITGKWEGDDGITYDFQDDGTLALVMEGMGEFTASYEVSDGNITIDMMGEKVTAPYKIDGNKMTITPAGEAEVVLERQ
jgi:hypothetical protein